MTRSSVRHDPMPAQPSMDGIAVLQPLGLAAVRLSDGFWVERQQVNRNAAIASGRQRLEVAGNLENLTRAAGHADPDAYRGPYFMDSDVYKWLEAVAWEFAREPGDELRRDFDEIATIVAAAQQSDGYLNSYVQVTGSPRYADLAFGHELYCYGHLLQAAVAARRAFGDNRLWQVALNVGDHLVRTFAGDGGNRGIDGHPIIEMALVELARESDDRRYAELARTFVERRGYNTLRAHGRHPSYFADRVPVRESTTVEGHAVRAVYLAAGATDVVLEGLDDAGYFAALRTQWQNMVAAKTYVTGGLGSRWDGEAFGDPYELPPDVAYCETCAAIGSVQWSWRMLLATGEVQYADLIERTLFNGMLAGVSLGGDEFFYVNALQLRSDVVSDDHRHPVNGRRGWFDVACCPPNVMRTLASLGGYVATRTADGVQVHQYASGTIDAGTARLRVQTAYPWDDVVDIEVEEPGDREFEIAVRIPAWCASATITVDEDEHPVSPGYHRVRRQWRAGEHLRVRLPQPARVTVGHPRADAVRGCVAIERGPLVYCVEQVDHPGLAIDDLEFRSLGAVERVEELLGGIDVVRFTAAAHGSDQDVAASAVPFFAWANRGAAPMRVWLPLAQVLP
jgi:hypothetical protein